MFSISKFYVIGETGVSWSKNCIFPYDEVNLILYTGALFAFSNYYNHLLTYSIVFLSENDIFLKSPLSG